LQDARDVFLSVGQPSLCTGHKPAATTDLDDIEAEYIRGVRLMTERKKPEQRCLFWSRVYVIYLDERNHHRASDSGQLDRRAP
jgi:hypothetical protein